MVWCVHKRHPTYYPILASIVCICMCKYFFPFINYKTMNKQAFDEQDLVNRCEMCVRKTFTTGSLYHSTLYGDLFVEPHKSPHTKTEKNAISTPTPQAQLYYLILSGINSNTCRGTISHIEWFRARKMRLIKNYLIEDVRMKNHV